MNDVKRIVSHNSVQPDDLGFFVSMGWIISGAAVNISFHLQDREQTLDGRGEGDAR